MLASFLVILHLISTIDKMFRHIPPITKNLLVINCLAYIASLAFGGYGVGMNELFGLHFFLASDFHVYQLFTYMFMHGGVAHLFFNMFALWMFGCTIEQAWGSRRFLTYTLVCGVGAGLFQEAAQFVTYAVEGLAAYDSVNVGGFTMPMAEYLNQWNTVGFSGAIYGILLGFGMTYPEERIFIFPLPVPIKGRWFVMIYAAIELFSALSTTGDGVAHIAHLGGMAVGWLLIRHWRSEYDHRTPRGGWDGYELRPTWRERLSGWWKAHKPQRPVSKNETERRRQGDVDHILEKIRRSGYDSLTDAERHQLFDRK